MTMDKAGIEKTIILSEAAGVAFDSVYKVYAQYPELERCYRLGARGVGELVDKGMGDTYAKPTPSYGMHLDDPRMNVFMKNALS